MTAKNGFRSRGSLERFRQRIQVGVTSIEYALIASLISVAVIAGLRAAGGENLNLWSYWTSAISVALSTVMN